MENPRPEKTAIVAEVKDRLSGSQAAILTEYRGIDVTSMQELRRALREAGGEYTIYKNTLVRFAARELGLEIEDLLTGPTAIAFVPEEGPGDPVMVAKALAAFSKTNDALVVKGGMLGDRLLSAEETAELAKVAPREELLARLAGGLAAPMQRFAGLLQAVPQSFAYGLAALIEQGGAPGAPASPPAADTTAEATEADAPDPAEAAVADAEDTAEAAVAQADDQAAGDGADPATTEES
jgi:large subunit ribosomal protein L10